MKNWKKWNKWLFLMGEMRCVRFAVKVVLTQKSNNERHAYGNWGLNVETTWNFVLIVSTSRRSFLHWSRHELIV